MKKFEFIGDRRKTFVKELLESWHKTLVRYETKLVYFDDLPYWYNERTNIGLLAAAAINIKPPKIGRAKTKSRTPKVRESTGGRMS